jgi:hypothetical protein
MDQDDARLVAQKVMDDFGEVGIAELPTDAGTVSGLFLAPNLPNPFRDQTVISYGLADRSAVRLKVYNVAGQLVNTLVDVAQDPGYYGITWSGLDDRGRRVSSGVYFCRLETETENAIIKMTMLR